MGGTVVYNGFLFVGLMNYLFGVGITLWGVAAWVALAERSTPVRTLASFAFCAVLYTCHLSVLGLYGPAVVSFEAWCLWSSRRVEFRAVLGRAVATGTSGPRTTTTSSSC